MFVRIRLPVGLPHPAHWSSTGPSGRTRGSKFVYVMDADNKVQYRRVTTGALQDDGLRVIDEGLKPDDWVVVGGLQQVRPRIKVRPDQMSMPTLAPTPVSAARRCARHRQERPGSAAARPVKAVRCLERPWPAEQRP